MTNIKLPIQEAKKSPSRINSKKTTPKHFTFKLQKTEDKDKILEDAK